MRQEPLSPAKQAFAGQHFQHQHVWHNPDPRHLGGELQSPPAQGGERVGQRFGRGTAQRFRLRLQRDPVQVLPMALTGLWGSMFSRWDRHNKRLKMPRRLFARVGLRIGELIEPDAAKAEVLEAAVKALRGDQA